MARTSKNAPDVSAVEASILGYGRLVKPDDRVAAWVGNEDAVARQVLADAAGAAVKLARQDPNTFCELVLRDERTGDPILQAPIHEEFQRIALTDQKAIIWAHCESGKCERRGAKILLGDGSWREIEKISITTPIITVDPVRMEPKIVFAGPSESNGTVECIQVSLSDRKLVLTHEHPLFVQGKGWTRCEDIELGDHVLVMNHVDLDTDTAFPDAELRGFLFDPLAKDSSRRGAYRIPMPETPDSVFAYRIRSTVEQMGWHCEDEVRHAHLYQKQLLILAGAHKNCPEQYLSQFLPYKVTDRNRAQAMLDIRTFPDEIFSARETDVRAFLRAVWSRARRLRALAKNYYYLRGRPLLLFQNRVYAEKIGRLMWRVGIPTFVPFQRMLFRYADGHHSAFVVACEEKDGLETLYRDDAPKPKMLVWKRVEGLCGAGLADTWALPVHDPCHCYISSGVVSHNTTQLSVGYPLWRLGNDPNLRALIVSNTVGQAVKIVRAQRSLIENSPAVRAIFPNLVPGESWADTYFSVQREHTQRDYSVQALGQRGNIQGARTDLLILDDILDEDNTRTKEARQDLMKWVRSTLWSRLSADAQVIIVGNAWNREDLMHELSLERGWESYRFPVVEIAQEPGQQDKILWPEKFSAERIEELRERHGPIEFARMFMCDARDDRDARFKIEWILNSLGAGAGRALLPAVADVPAGHVNVTGVDLAVKARPGHRSRAAKSVILTLDVDLLTGQKVLIGLESGSWGAPELIRKIAEHQHRYDSRVFVETNAAQAYLVQMIPAMGYSFPVNSFETGRNKHDPTYGVESIATELAIGSLILPSGNGTIESTEPEVRRLVDDMVYYNPAVHTGDFLMALWIAREGSRMKKPRGRVMQHGLLSR